MDSYITLDIGGTNIRCALFLDGQDEPVDHRKIDTVAQGQTPIMRVISVIKEIWPANHEVKGICAAVPGSVNIKTGTVLLAPNITGWENIKFADILKDEFDVPVFVNNDARLAAIGEWKKGAGKGHENLLYFTISTGLGGGAIVHNRVLEGDLGIATESGHVTLDDKGPLCGCGKYGHLEAFSAGTGIESFVKTQISLGVDSILKTQADIHASEIASAAREGDALATAAYKRAGYYLGIGIANYLHIFNPSCVIFGGGVTQSSDLWMAEFNKSLEDHLLNPMYLENLEIKMAELGDNVGLVGANEYLKELLNRNS
ncbi:MAG: ROK family protein [Chloroflexi bacterium]|nr:ROK family protein [Chloroflexota bacterium]